MANVNAPIESKPGNHALMLITIIPDLESKHV